MADMALIDALRDLSDLPESHIPALNEIQQIVGKLAAFVEHGEEIFKAAEAGRQDVAELLAQPTDTGTDPAAHDTGAPAPATADVSASAPAVDTPAAAPLAPDEKDAEIAALQQQVQTLLAQQQRTQVSVTSAEADAPASPSYPGETPA